MDNFNPEKQITRWNHEKFGFDYHEPYDYPELKIDPKAIKSDVFDIQTALCCMVALMKFNAVNNIKDDTIFVIHDYGSYTLMMCIIKKINSETGKHQDTGYIKSIDSEYFKKKYTHTPQIISLRGIEMEAFIQGNCKFVKCKTLIEKLRDETFKVD